MSSPPCGALPPGGTYLFLDVPGGADGYAEQSIEVPSESSTLRFLTWGNLESVDVTVSAVSGGAATPLSTFSPPTVEGPEAGECSGLSPVTQSVDLSAYAGKKIGLRLEAAGFGVNGTIAGITKLELGSEGGTVSGAIETPADRPSEGVAVELKGKSDTEKEVDMTAKTAKSGSYKFSEVPAGNYAVTASGDATEEVGGTLALRKSPTSGGGLECEGTVKDATCTLKHLETGGSLHANYTYTPCGTSEREVKGKEPTGCPIIFIPGFLGSRLFCATGETWTNIPNPDFADMQLESDGSTDKAGNSCSSTVGPHSGEEGVVRTAAGADIYGKVLDYLNRIAPGRTYAFPYDWRKSPQITEGALKSLVNEVLEKSGAKHVVLLGHSMGGLVLQNFIKSSSDAEKVSRALTLGTPYWGAVKSHVSLMTGKSNEVEIEVFGLDLFIKSSEAEATELTGGNPFANDLQLAARNMQGLYWLYPADEFGPWLQVKGRGYPSGFMSSSGIRAWVSSLGGTPQLITNAVSGHHELSGFPSNGVDFQVLAGAGTPTESAMSIEEKPESLGQPVQVWYRSGDGTVPLDSATEGASEGKSVSVPIHYACGVSHIALPGNPGVQGRIEGFLLKGEKIGGPDENCPYTGVSTKVFERVIPEHGKAAVGSAAAAQTTKMVVRSGARVVSLGQAAAEGLATVTQVGGARFVAIDERSGAKLEISGRNVAFEVRKISSAGNGNSAGSGPAVSYGPVSGTVTVTAKDSVTKAGKKLRAVKRHGRPRTRARVSRDGKRYLVRLSAKAPAGVAVTYYRIGKSRLQIYRKPLRLTRKQLKALRFESVDRFGVWEPARRAS